MLAALLMVSSATAITPPPVFYFNLNTYATSTAMALDFGEWNTSVSVWPEPIEGEALVFRSGMQGWYPVEFYSANVSVPVICMATVPVYCYKTYDQHLAAVLLGSTCAPHVTYKATQTTKTFSSAAARQTALLDYVHGTEKVALEVTTPLSFTVYTQSTDIDTVSSMTIPLILIVFLTSWLGWTKAISYHSMRKPRVPEGLWEALCASYGIIVLDITALCVATYGLDVRRGYAILRGGEAIDLVGFTTAERLAYGWVFVLGALLGIVFAGLVYGYQYTEHGKTILQRERVGSVTASQYLLAVLALLVVGTMSYAIVALENIHATWLVIMIVTSSVVAMLVTLRYATLYRWYSRTFRLPTHVTFDTPYLLLLRWSVQTIVLTTLHATLPITLDTIRSTTYRNGIGFVLGCMISGTAGRDVVWLLQHEHCKQRRLLWLEYSVAGLLFMATLGYVSVFMVGPVFMSSTLFVYRPTAALLGAIATSIQAFALGVIYAVLRRDTIASTQT